MGDALNGSTLYCSEDMEHEVIKATLQYYSKYSFCVPLIIVEVVNSTA